MVDRQRIGRRTDIEGGEDARLLVLLVQESESWRSRTAAWRGAQNPSSKATEVNGTARDRSHRYLPVISMRRR